ncbi:hypothetical protein ACP93_02585 [Xanthomonas sp. NCPPB 1128]|uniref:DUF7940 domain-containing protein n=1 Tax=Xanthomonas sp. NCPPB 1128 TaxID=1775876 RepID=UPI00065A9C1E|nr:hypothetical protein [Xanthomonas sp. NCPPB 1128]KMM77069.1 hypothetical protein ACP93_02320 [Xanthomonas sp. NCPPB 1128]KMM77113.1 hypothetical protein ACP93_02585 [Xanthomonas sp. NCPPB 1128]
MKVELIEDWRRAWKLASVQVFAGIALLPDIYNGVAALGWMDELPGPAKWIIRSMGAAGVIARIVRQNSPAPRA